MTHQLFKIIKTSSTNRARLGLLRTPHGVVHTPAYVMVATRAQIKTLRPSDIRATGTQIVIANGYHLWGQKNAHKTLGVQMPMMTDSGGFQMFSFGAAREYGVGKVLVRKRRAVSEPNLVKVSEKGLTFLESGKPKFMSPEISIDIQRALGSDIILALDECTSPLHSFSHTKRAMERTHRWLKRCIARASKKQSLYGIIQGGRFKSLRKQSARFVASQSVAGVGIGGSFGKRELSKTLEYIIPELPEDKPRHLLGIGTIKDIFSAVEAGIDTMDCVIPTREARHGKIYTLNGPIDIRKGIFAGSRANIDCACKCSACSQKITCGKLHALFRAKDLRAGRFATIHNVWFFNNLLKNIRTALNGGSYASFKKKILKRFDSN